jgi:hypothetical protein
VTKEVYRQKGTIIRRITSGIYIYIFIYLFLFIYIYRVSTNVYTFYIITVANVYTFWHPLYIKEKVNITVRPKTSVFLSLF